MDLKYLNANRGLMHRTFAIRHETRIHILSHKRIKFGMDN